MSTRDNKKVAIGLSCNNINTYIYDVKRESDFIYECMQVIRKISSCMFVRVYSRVRLELKLQANEHAKFDFFLLVK